MGLRECTRSPGCLELPACRDMLGVSPAASMSSPRSPDQRTDEAAALADRNRLPQQVRSAAASCLWITLGASAAVQASDTPRPVAAERYAASMTRVTANASRPGVNGC
jgi:hypothetical protein